MKGRKALAILLTVCMVLTMTPLMAFADSEDLTVNQDSRFPDIAGHWAANQINKWIDLGLIKGYNDGTFKPDNNITRAEFMTLVNGAFQYTEKADIDFSDVAEDAWYAEAVQKAKAAGYISGYPDNTMRPDNPISREEAAAIIKGITHVEGNPEGKTSFTDQGSLSWSKDAVVAVSETEIMNGYPDGNFKPQNLIKRAEAVVALDTALNYSKSSVVYDKAGTYGPETGVLEVEGDLIVLVKDVKLQNILIKGNLVISKNVGDGEVTLDNVTVKGESRIYGGGENSIIIINSTLGNVKVYKEDGKIRIVISGNTTVEGVTVNSGATLETEGLTDSNAGFQEIILEASENDTIVLKGTFNQVEVKYAGIEVQVPSGTTVNNLVLNSAAEVTGTGTIDNAQVNADDVSFETEPKKVETAPGVAAPVVKEPAPIVPGGGGGGGSTTVAVKGISVDAEAITLGVGEIATITATVEPEDATNKTVTWSTSDADIATVDNGVVTAVAEGVVTITATAGGKTAEVVINVLSAASPEETAELLEWFVGWPTLTFYNEERGNRVHYDFKLKEGKISDLQDVTVSIYKDDEKIATNTLKEPNIHNGAELTGSFYTNDIKETDSWYVEQISGALGENIFNKIELRAIYGEKVYIVDVAELKPIEGNVKNLTLGKGYNGLQEAINEAAIGDNTIVVNPGEYGEECINIIQKEGVNIFLQAIGEVVLKNQIRIDGGGRYEDAEDTLTIRGFTFDFSDAAGDIITTDLIESTYRVYAHNVSFEDCTFIGNKDNNTVVAVRAAAQGGHKNFAFKNCTGIDLHSLGQLTSVTGVTVEDCTVENAGEGGLNLPSSKDIKITNLTVDGTLYGVRTGPGGETANAIGKLTISDSVLKAEYPMWLRKGSPETVMVFNTNLVVKGDGEEIKNDAVVNVLIDPTVYNEDLKIYYMTIQKAIDEALEGDNNIKVSSGNHGTEPIQIVQKEGVNITLEAVGEVVLRNQIQIDGNERSDGRDTLTIKGFTFDFSNAIANDIIATAKIESSTYVYAHNVFVENCTFIGNPDKSVVAVKAFAQGGHYNFQLKGCTGTNLHSLAQLTGVTGVTVKDCNVIGALEGGLNLQHSTDIKITKLMVDAQDYGVRAGQGSETGTVNENNTLTISDSELNAKYPIWLRNDAPGTVIITDSTLTASDDGEMIYNDANGTVNITIDGAVYVGDMDELLAALSNDAFETIYLEDGNYGAVLIQNVARPVSLVAMNQYKSCFESIEIKSSDVTIDGVTAGYIDFYSVDNITITNSLVTGNRFSIAIGAAGGGNNGPATITNNIVQDGAIGLMPTHIFEDYTITGNTVDKSQDEGIWLWYGGSHADKVNSDSVASIAEKLVNDNIFGDYFEREDKHKVKVQFGVNSDKIFR
jgi:hypothetical protein